MPKFGIGIISKHCLFKTVLGLCKISFALKNVTKVEVDLGIQIVILFGFEEHLLGNVKVLRVKVSHAKVLLVVG